MLREGLAAGKVATVVGGIPSTVHAVLTGGDPLEAAAAAGSLLLRNEKDKHRLVAAGLFVHLCVSMGWSIALAATLPRRKPWVWGAFAGAAIAAVDLGVMGRRFPRIRALPVGPQVADHVLFGMAVGAALTRRGT